MRAPLLACSFLLACSEVTVVPNDGGGSPDDGIAAGVGVGGEGSVGAGTPGVGGASSGVGGGGPEESRLIEIALVAPLDGPVEDVVVLVNGAYGELRATYTGSELPVMAEVVDGDLVSFYVPDLDPGTLLTSYRVRPAVWRIAENGPQGSGSCDELEPMSLTFDVPAVPGANEYRISWAYQSETVEPGPQTISVAACTTDVPLELLVTAGADFFEPIAYQLILLPYVPGEAAVVPLALTTAQQDIEVLVPAVQGDVWVNGFWTTDWKFASPWASPDWEPTPGGYAASFIAPGGGFAWVNALWSSDVTVDGWCTSSANQQRVPSAPGAVVLDGSPPDLAQPITLGDGMFGLADDGPRGDLLWQSFRVEPDPTYNWIVYDDPWAVATPLVFPELPPGDPWGLDPGGPLPLAAIGHENRDAIHGYSDSVTKLESGLFSPTRFRNIHLCD